MTTASEPPTADPHQEAIDWPRLLTLHEGWLRRVILARTGEQEAVDEVWQQVALAAVEQRWPLADQARVAPWLHRLAVIAAARYGRQQGRRRRALAGWSQMCQARNATCAPDPLARLMQEERVGLIREAMLRLGGRDAEVLLLKYGERWSYRQLALHLGITEKAVDSRLLRARDRLRRQLAALGIDELNP